MLNTNGIKAVILMGGTGERFGSAVPKQFHRLAGKKVYLYTLETFLASDLFEEIILVCPLPWVAQVKEDIALYSHVSIAIGGATRQESSLNGLLACGKETHIVVIHDAVRPFVSKEILKGNVEAAIRYRAVDTCIASADTLVHAPQGETIAAIPSRKEYLRGQTPQSFAYPLILEAHLKAKSEGNCNNSDDCAIALCCGHPISIVQGSEENIKITSELDLFLAEQILRLKATRIRSSDQNHSLQNKHIAVTGGTGGIGRALCRLLEAEGAIPIVLSRSAKKYSVDLTCFESAKTTFDLILNDFGPLDGLINSIGLLRNKNLGELSHEEIDSLIATNLTGVIYSCKCAHLKQGAHIVNIASSSYTRGRKNVAIYTSAKAAIVNFSQGLAEERQDLLINAIAPQRTHTAMRFDNFPDENPETLLHPDDVAREIITLLKTRAVTGTLIDVRKHLQN